MELVDHVVANGLWLTKGGIGSKIGNQENAPRRTLLYFAIDVIKRYTRLADPSIEATETC